MSAGGNVDGGHITNHGQGNTLVSGNHVHVAGVQGGIVSVIEHGAGNGNGNGNGTFAPPHPPSRHRKHP